MTMALEKSSLNDLVVIDSNPLNRITTRRKLSGKYPTTTAGHLPGKSVADAVMEFWKLIIQLLPRRYPTVFSTAILEDGTRVLKNAVNKSSMHLSPIPGPREALEYFGKTLDEDFLLLPSPDGDGYTLQAYISAFAAHFDASTLLKKKVRDIHAGVPRYKEKLMMSMERYLERIKIGQFVRRVKWSIVTRPGLFTASTKVEESSMHSEDVDIGQMYQQSETQQLFRLPKSKALVFVIKTYQYPIGEVMEEGLGEVLEEAIEGLENGNVPKIAEYKKSPVWKGRVREYWRS